MTDDRPAVLVLDNPMLDGPALRDELTERLPAVDVRVADADDPEGLAAARIVAAQNLTDDHLATAEALEWLHAISAGYDHFPTDALSARDVTVTNASGVHAEPAGEQVLAYLLTFERRLHRAVRQQTRREWDRFGGGELRGKTVGIVGPGAIGGRVAELAAAVGTTVLGTKRDPSTAPAALDEVYAPGDLHAMLSRSDYVVLACPLTESTRGLIDADALAAMGEDSVLVNVARGEVVDEDALVDALRADEIGGAALDVFDTEPLPESSPLWEQENVVVTPHMAGSTPAYWARNADIVAGNYDAFLDGDLAAMTNRVL